MLVVRHWWAFEACDFLQLYAISELLLMDRIRQHEARPQKLTNFGVRLCFRASSPNSDQVLSFIRVILFFVCVRKDCETDQFKPSFID